MNLLFSDESFPVFVRNFLVEKLSTKTLDGLPLHCFIFPSLSLFHSRNRIRCAMFFNCLNTFQKLKKKDRIAFYFKPLETYSKILKDAADGVCSRISIFTRLAQ